MPDDRKKLIMPGRFACAKCGTKYRLRHTPGVLDPPFLTGPGPVGPLDNPCPRCGGPVLPQDAAAHEVAQEAEAREKDLEEMLTREH